MNITGITVCVGYADHLAYTLPAWTNALRLCDVCTTFDDDATLHFVSVQQKAHGHYTDLFYRNGAAFNKAAALNEDLTQGWRTSEWVLLFDCDILPPADLGRWLENADLKPGNIYGAERYDASTRAPIHPTDPEELPGFFQLFHTADPHAQPDANGNILDTTWTHAGGYDTVFQARWPADHRVRLPIPCLHLGEPGLYWHGRTDPATAKQRMADLYASRRTHGGWQNNPQEHILKGE